MNFTLCVVFIYYNNISFFISTISLLLSIFLKSIFLFSTRSLYIVFLLWIAVNFFNALSFCSSYFSLKTWFTITVNSTNPVNMIKRYLFPLSEYDEIFTLNFYNPNLVVGSFISPSYTFILISLMLLIVLKEVAKVEYYYDVYAFYRNIV